MRFTAIQLRPHDVRLDDLSPGMNVVYAPAAEQRRLLPAAVRAAIFGGIAEELPDCRIALQTNWGGFHLEYHGHDGSIHATNSHGADRTQWLEQKLATLTTEAAFTAVYTPRWGDPVALDTLACVLCGDGLSGKRLAAFETLLRDLEKTRSWRERDQQLEQLRTRQAQLEGQLEQVRDDERPAHHRSLRSLEAKIHRHGERLVHYQKAIQRLENQLQTDRTAATHAASIRSLRKRMFGLQRHVQRLVLVLRDLRERSRQLRVRIGLDPSHPLVRSSKTAKKKRLLLQKYRKMMRCQTVLSEQLAALLSRRQRLQIRLDRLSEAKISQRQREAIVTELRKCQKRERVCRTELKVLEARRASILAKRSQQRGDTEQTRQLESELSRVRARLARWALDEQREADALLARLRTFFAERRNPAVLNEAATLLRQLSDNALIGIRAGNHGRELIVEHADGRSVACDVLSRAERVQVQLSLCLAAAAHAAHRGANFPVLLNDVTRNIEPARLRAAIELLRNHGRAAGQVILLTSQSHVATLCRSLGASSYSLEPTAEVAPFVQREPAAREEKPIHETSWDCEEFPGELRDRMRARHQHPHAIDVVTSMNGAAHAELNGHEGARADRCPEENLRASGHYLELCDRVTEIPFIARNVSQALEREGIYTVANLLHADATQLASRLGELDVTTPTIRDWQSQARLMCTVRRMRGYDARILTACGITTAEQLADIQPHELYGMIRAFVATPEGSRVVRSGADHEVARLTQWIRSLQRTRQRSGSDHGDNRKANRKSVVASCDRAADGKASAPKKEAADSKAEKRTKKVRKVAHKRTADIIPLRFHLDVTSHVEAAPAIGPTMAKKLEKVGILTVGQLLNATPEEVARDLRTQRVSAETVRQWQRQASLVCRVPELRGHDAQVLVACGVETPERLAAYSPDDLNELVLPFVKTKQGRRLLRSGKEPDTDEIARWIHWARHARHLAAA